MKPYYEHAGITIYHGDCFDVVPRLSAPQYDAVITDPPYGVAFDRATWDDNPAEYGALMRRLIAACETVTRPEAVFAFWQALRNAPRWHEWFPSDYRIFAACKGFVPYHPTPVQWSWDPVVWWGTPQTNPSVYAKDWHVQTLAPFGQMRPKVDHPCPKPLESVRYLISILVRPGQTLLDPMMGSGTTLRAALDCGCKAVGIEIEERYCEIAAKRLAQECLTFD